MKMKFLSSFALLSLMLVACGGNANKKDNAASEQTAVVEEQAPAQADYCATYFGVLPAADCGGIETTLTLNADKTYNLKKKYLNGKDEAFETNGVYELKGEDLVELTTPSTNAKTYYKIVEGNVVLSDAEGVVNDGELAEHYVLKRK